MGINHQETQTSIDRAQIHIPELATTEEAKQFYRLGLKCSEILIACLVSTFNKIISMEMVPGTGFAT